MLAAHQLFIDDLMDALPGHAEVFSKACLVASLKRVLAQQVTDRQAKLLKAFCVSSYYDH